MAFIGGMMAHTPFAYLYELFGWRRALLIDGAVGAALLIWISLIVKDKPAEAPVTRHTNQGKIIPSFINALANGQNWLAGLYTCLLNLPIMVLCALWGASYLQVAHHLPDIAASNVISLIFMGSVIGCPLVGWLSDSQGRRKPLMIFGAVATLICLIPLFMHLVLSQTALSVLFFFLGLFTSTQVISYPLIAESNDAENTGSSTGIASVLIMGGAGVGQVLFGWLMTYHAHHTTQYVVDDFQFALWIFPIAAVAALVAVLMTRETYCKR
jgi:MFS family permease